MLKPFIYRCRCGCGTWYVLIIMWQDEPLAIHTERLATDTHENALMLAEIVMAG